MLADDPERRRTVAVGGYTVTAVLSSLIGVATAVGQVAVLRVGAWLARGIRVPPRSALLADVTSPGTYGRAFGFERMMDNPGGRCSAGALGLVAVLGIRGAIVVSGVFGLAAAGSIVYAIRHIQRPSLSERQPLLIRISRCCDVSGWSLAADRAFEVGNLATTLLILRATELLTRLGREAATSIALLLYAGHNLSATVIAFPAGKAAPLAC